MPWDLARFYPLRRQGAFEESCSAHWTISATAHPCGRLSISVCKMEVGLSICLHLQMSDMIAQHEFGRMRIQESLSSQVGHVGATKMVGEQRQRHDERHVAGCVRLDERQQLGAITLIQRVLEITEHVLEHIAVPARSGHGQERLHEPCRVLRLQRGAR